QQGKVPQRNLEVGGGGSGPRHLSAGYGPVAAEKIVQGQSNLQQRAETLRGVGREESLDMLPLAVVPDEPAMHMQGNYSFSPGEKPADQIRALDSAPQKHGERLGGRGSGLGHESRGGIVDRNSWIVDRRYAYARSTIYDLLSTISSPPSILIAA